MLKPGGHGVIWKESLDQRVFEWLRQQKRTKVLIRQINNPIGGIDKGIIALRGWDASLAKPLVSLLVTDTLARRKEWSFCGKEPFLMARNTALPMWNIPISRNVGSKMSPRRKVLLTPAILPIRTSWSQIYLPSRKRAESVPSGYAHQH